MTMYSPQFAVALTHVFKGVARFTASGAAGQKQARQRPRRAVRPSNEGQRRTRVLEALYREHSADAESTRDDLPDLQTLPPDSWINTKLAALGEPWRVHNVDGFRCEIYDVR